MKYNIFPLPLLSSLAHPIPFHPLPFLPLPICTTVADVSLVQNYRDQVEYFKTKGRYLETQQNLAVFAIKERYMYIQYHNFYVPQIPIYVVVLTLSHMPTV